MMKAEKLYFFVDSVSEGVAVLLADGASGQRLVLPLAMLPMGTAEGDHLLVSFERDAGRSESARQETARLMDGLGDDP